MKFKVDTMWFRDEYFMWSVVIFLVFSGSDFGLIDASGWWRVTVLAASVVMTFYITSRLQRRFSKDGYRGMPGWTVAVVVLIGITSYGVGRIFEGITHSGPGVIFLGDGDRVDIYPERVSESQYRRHHIANGFSPYYWPYFRASI